MKLSRSTSSPFYAGMASDGIRGWFSPSPASPSHGKRGWGLAAGKVREDFPHFGFSAAHDESLALVYAADAMAAERASALVAQKRFRRMAEEVCFGEFELSGGLFHMRMILRGAFATIAAFTMKRWMETGGAFPTFNAFTMKTSLGAAWDMGGVFAFIFTMKRLARRVRHESRAVIFTMNLCI